MSPRLLVLGMLLIPSVSSANSIQFDTPQFTSGVQVASIDAAPQLPNGQWVQVKLDVSAAAADGFQGQLDEISVKIFTRSPMVHVADFWPRTEMYSQVTTTIQVVEDHDKWNQGSLHAVGGYPGIGSARIDAQHVDRSQRDVQFEQAPPMQLLVASGTLNRGAGAYFKLRANPQVTLEGLRTFAVTLEVPPTWRGDIIEVQTTAYGRTNDDKRRELRELGHDRFWVAVYRQGDEEAARFSLAFAQNQTKLREISLQYAVQIRKRAYPTPVHRLGEALDIYEPKIDNDFLTRWMFGSLGDQPNSYLPVEVRVAMLDFIDSRAIMERLSSAQLDTRTPSIANHRIAHEVR